MPNSKTNYSIADKHIVITGGRVRAGYVCGELLFGEQSFPNKCCGIVHIIGERPGSGHHNFSVYLTVAQSSTWNKKGAVDHDISKVVSGISDTSLTPKKAVKITAKIADELFLNQRI